MNLIAELESEVAHSRTITAAADMWMQRALAAERDNLYLTMALVKAAGGTIEVAINDLRDLPRLELIKMERPERMSVTYKVRPAREASNDPSNTR